MTSERSKRRDFLSLIFISKSISKKLLIEKKKNFCKLTPKAENVTGKLLFSSVFFFSLP